MSVKSGQAVTVRFTTANPTTGAAADADSLPTGTLTVNGTDNAAAVTVTDVGVGRYKAAVTLPALSAGDMVAIEIAATVATVAGASVVWQDVADTKRVSDLADLTAASTRTALGLATADLDTQLDAILAASAGGNGGDKTLTYRVLLDSDGDGVADVPNVGVPGVRCVLSDTADSQTIGNTQTSDTLGYVKWWGLVEGDYHVHTDDDDHAQTGTTLAHTDA